MIHINKHYEYTSKLNIFHQPNQISTKKGHKNYKIIINMQKNVSNLYGNNCPYLLFYSNIVPI